MFFLPELLLRGAVGPVQQVPGEIFLLGRPELTMDLIFAHSLGFVGAEGLFLALHLGLLLAELRRPECDAKD